MNLDDPPGGRAMRSAPRPGTLSARSSGRRRPATCRACSTSSPPTWSCSATTLEPAEVNGCPALILRIDGEIDSVIAVRIDDGLISGLYSVRNPAKLSHLDRETTLRR